MYVAILATFYYSCCRDGDYDDNTSERKIEQKQVHQKETRKLNDLYLQDVCHRIH